MQIVASHSLWRSEGLQGLQGLLGLLARAVDLSKPDQGHPAASRYSVVTGWVACIEEEVV